MEWGGRAEKPEVVQMLAQSWGYQSAYVFASPWISQAGEPDVWDLPEDEIKEH
jgi:hypothetical protein